MRNHLRVCLLVGGLLFFLGAAGCGSGKPKDSAKSPEELRNYVSTPVEWVGTKLTDGGVVLNAPREKLTTFIQQENYRVCTSRDSYFHAMVPNSKLHPGEQDIHIIAMFNSEGNISQLDVSTQTTALMDLMQDCH